MSHSVSITVSVDGLSATIAVPAETAVDLLLRYLISGGTVTHPPTNILETILFNTERLMQMSSTVSGEIATLATDVTALTAAVQAAVAGFATLNAEIAALQASGGLSASDAASLTASVNTVATETAALAAATPPAPPPASP